MSDEAAGPIRLLFVIGSLGGGGAERCTIDLLNGLDRAKFAPELYLSYRKGELLADVPADVPVHAFVDGPVEQTLWARAAGKLRLLHEARMLDLYRLFRRRKFDLVFAWGLKHAYETAAPCRAFGIPRIAYCVQDPAAELRDDFPHPTPWRWRVARWAYRSGSVLYANAADLCRRMEQFYRLPDGSVRLLLNLRDFDRLERLAQETPAEWPATGTRIVCVGRMEPPKGHSVLLDAVAELVQRRQRDVQLAIVGQGLLEPQLRQQAERLGIADRILWAGFQSNPFPFFKAADVFVLPSLREGLPNVLIEALALGTPSVAADCPTGPREILEDGRWGTLFPVGDSHALAAALDQVLEHLPQERDRAQSAMLEMRARFGLEAGVRRLEREFLELIQSQSP
jgi:glycosyltransferase involved in cell wall biosynthesis